MTDESPKPKPISLTKLDFETLEAFFPSEHPTPKETGQENAEAEDDFEARRKRFFGISESKEVD